jgi:hypothetical protein
MKRNPKISGLFPSQGQYVFDERTNQEKPTWGKDQLEKLYLVKRPVGKSVFGEMTSRLK